MAKIKVANGKIESENKALALETFDALFNKRDYAAAEKFWSPHYIQHSPHLAPGQESFEKCLEKITLADLIRQIRAKGR